MRCDGAAPVTSSVAFGTIVWLTSSLLTDEPSETLRSLVHAAIFAVFGLVSYFGRHDIGKLFVFCFSVLILYRFEDSILLSISVILASYIASECDTLSPAMLMALYAASSIPFDVGGSKIDNLNIALTSHRAFLCAIGGSKSSAVLSGFAVGQLLLVSRYMYFADTPREGKSWLILLIVAVVKSLLDAAPSMWRDMHKVWDGETTTSSRLPILDCIHGRWGLVAAVTHASALYYDCIIPLIRSEPYMTTATQSVHIAAITGFTTVIGPLLSLAIAKKFVWLASLIDCGMCLWTRSMTDLSVCFRFAANIAISTSYFFLSQRRVIKVDKAEEQTAPRIPFTRIAIGVVGLLIYVASHYWVGTETEYLDEAIAFDFHFSYLTTVFVLWAWLFEDRTPWWLAIEFLTFELLTSVLFSLWSQKQGDAVLYLMISSILPVMGVLLGLRHDKDKEYFVMETW